MNAFRYIIAVVALAAVWLLSCLPPLTLYYLVAIVGATTLSVGLMTIIEWLDAPKEGR